jgi:elongation factor Tu
VAELDDRRPELNILTLGHSQHGKTTLTAALTKVSHLRDSAIPYLSFDEVDDAQEERREGLGITMSRVKYATKKRKYVHADFPGHVDTMKAMLSGHVQLDGAILVVSAADGSTPLTKEQLSLAKKMGVPAIVVFLSKTDMTEEDLVDIVEMELSELLGTYDYAENSPIVRGSALEALDSSENTSDAEAYEGIVELMGKLDDWIPTPTPVTCKPFLMPIDRAFKMQDRIMVAGLIESGEIEVNHDVEIVGLKATATAKCVAIFYKNLQGATHGRTGESVNCQLSGVAAQDLERGQVLAKPDSIFSHTKFKGEVYRLSSEESRNRDLIGTNSHLNFGFRTAEVIGTITLPDGMETLGMGVNANLSVTLQKSVAMKRGSRFQVIKDELPIALGVVTEIVE